MARGIGMDVGHYHRLEHARELDVSLDWLALTIADEPKASVKRKSVAASRKIF